MQKLPRLFVRCNCTFRQGIEMHQQTPLHITHPIKYPKPHSSQHSKPSVLHLLRNYIIVLMLARWITPECKTFTCRTLNVDTTNPEFFKVNHPKQDGGVPSTQGVKEDKEKD